MARAVAEPCILCEQIKCSCGKPAPAPKTTRKRAPKVEAAVPPVAVSPQPVEQPTSTVAPWDEPQPVKQSARAAMKARAARSTVPAPTVEQGDPIMETAIRNVAPLLAPDERNKYAHLAVRATPVANRADAWKQRKAAHG